MEKLQQEHDALDTEIKYVLKQTTKFIPRHIMYHIQLLSLILLLLLNVFISDANSRHSELCKLLEEVQVELSEAKVDKHENARHQKKQEVLESMKRLFPGVYGRLIELCEPVHKK